MYKNLKIASVIGFLVVFLTVTLNAQAKPSEAMDLQNLAPQEFLSDDGLTVTIHSTAEKAMSLMNYWTPARRQAAHAVPFPSEYEGDFAETSGELPEGMLDMTKEAIGEPGFAEGALPDPEAEKSAQLDYPFERQAMDNNQFLPQAAPEDFSDYGTKAVFTSYLTNFFSNMYLDYPYGAVGKLYITGGGYCTASVISSNVVITAAHCVFDTKANRWESGWTFVPADQNGSAPYGTFAWSDARVLNAWINASGTLQKADVALIKLYPNSSGNNVSYYTGFLGRSWNNNYFQHLHAIGYPSNLYGGGSYTFTCSAETFANGIDVLGMGCNMTYGSSGGPWIIRFAPNQGGYVNQVNSVVSGGTPGTNTFYGARFSNANIIPLCGTSTCWP